MYNRLCRSNSFDIGVNLSLSPSIIDSGNLQKGAAVINPDILGYLVYVNHHKINMMPLGDWHPAECAGMIM